MAAAVEIDAHGKVEILLAAARDDRGQVKHRYIVPVDQPVDRLAVGNVAQNDPDPFVPVIGRVVRERVVEQHEFVDRCPGA